MLFSPQILVRNQPQRVVAGGSLGLQTSLGAFFSLDNTLNDATGNLTALTNNNTVTFVSSTPSPIAAVTNSAKFVSASSQYLSHAAATAINMGSTSFSLQIWYYNAGGGGAVPLNKYVGFGDGDFSTGSSFTGGASPVTFSANVSVNTPVSSGNQTQNTWHHYVFTYNSSGGAQNIYVDGSAVANNTASNAPSGTGILAIGADTAPANFVEGNISLVGLWKGRVLSAGDVTSLYNSGNGRSYAAMA